MMGKSELYMEIEKLEKEVSKWKLAYDNACFECFECERIKEANKILDEKEKLVVTQIDEEGAPYQHPVGLTKTEKRLREVLK